MITARISDFKRRKSSSVEWEEDLLQEFQETRSQVPSLSRIGTTDELDALEQEVLNGIKLFENLWARSLIWRPWYESFDTSSANDPKNVDTFCILRFVTGQDFHVAIYWLDEVCEDDELEKCGYFGLRSRLPHRYQTMLWVVAARYFLSRRY